MGHTKSIIAFSATALTVVLIATGNPAPLAAQESPGGIAPPTPCGGADSLSDATVRKAGAALHRVLQIRKDFSERMKAAPTPDQQHGLAQQAEGAAVEAVNRQGLSIEQYNEVIRKAQADPALRKRLLAAAQRPQE
jgi:hypothetical protein